MDKLARLNGIQIGLLKAFDRGQPNGKGLQTKSFRFCKDMLIDLIRIGASYQEHLRTRQIAICDPRRRFQMIETSRNCDDGSRAFKG